MIYALKIRLTSQMLGDVLTHEKIRRFERCRGSEDLQPDSVHWRWALTQAQESLRMDVHLDTILIPPAIRAPRIDMYRRNYRYPKKVNGKDMRVKAFEDFESINIGTVLTIPLHVSSALPGKTNTKSISEHQLKQLFRYIGKFIGLSPWGGKFDYGRFKVLSIDPVEDEKDIFPDLYN